jgi:Uma2 family endonuclease
MATSVLIPMSEYLNTTYRPDREYLDGEVVERRVGKWEHSRVQALLTGWFIQHEGVWNIQTATEWRTQVSHTRVRIPDIVLVQAGVQPDVLTDAPLLVVEILSPDDSYSDTQQRAEDYLRMGVATIWIIDPATRTGRVCSGSNWVQGDRLEVAGTDVYVPLDRVFAALVSGGVVQDNG